MDELNCGGRSGAPFVDIGPLLTMLATPVRCYPLGFAVLFTAAPRSPKLRNIAIEPRVSVGVFAPLVGLPLSRPPEDTLVVVDPNRIVYTEHWLRREAFAPRQFWRQSSPGASAPSRTVRTTRRASTQPALR